jgi:hypothetical protein
MLDVSQPQEADVSNAKLYISVEAPSGHLVITGPLALLRELIGSFGATERPATDAAVVDGVPADRESPAHGRQPEPVR